MHEPEVELRRHPGCAIFFVAALVSLVVAALELELRWGWIAIAPPLLFLIAMVRASVTPRVFLTLVKDGGERERIPLGVEVAPEQFVVFYAKLVKVAQRARRGETDEDEDEDDEPSFERSELDDYYKSMAIVLRDGRVAFALTCRDVPQLLEAAAHYYRAAVESIRAGREGWRGPVILRVNPRSPRRSRDAVQALETCLAECRVWSGYSGPAIGVSWEWDEVADEEEESGDEGSADEVDDDEVEEEVEDSEEDEEPDGGILDRDGDGESDDDDRGPDDGRRRHP